MWSSSILVQWLHESAGDISKYRVYERHYTRPQFYQTKSAWSMDQGSTKKRSTVVYHNFVPTVTKFCVLWEGLSLPQDTKFGNCRDEIVDRRVIFIWSLIHGSSWSGLIKVGPGIIQLPIVLHHGLPIYEIRCHTRFGAICANLANIIFVPVIHLSVCVPLYHYI